MSGSHKILITGANGFLGKHLSCNIKKYRVAAYSKNELDITKEEQLDKVLNSESPSIIVHTAAYTDVDGCEMDPIKAFRVNALPLKKIADYCEVNDTILVYISSTGIYGGTKKSEPYKENDNPGPTTVHHMSKLCGEVIIKKKLEKYFIIRTGWLFGGGSNKKKDFVLKRYFEAIKSKEVLCNSEQIGNPTSISSLTKQIELLINTEKYGIFNCVNSGENVTRYEYIKEIIRLFDIKTNVMKAPLGFPKRIAPVSMNESAENYNLKKIKINIMENWKEALKLYIKNFK